VLYNASVKKKLLTLFLAFIIFVTFIVFRGHGFELSDSQKETVSTFGYPSQFVITYMPVLDQESNSFIRTEVWYYPHQQLKIIFQGGDVFAVEEFSDMNYLELAGIVTNLKPEAFHFDQNRNKVARFLNSRPQQFETFIDKKEKTAEDNLSLFISDEAFFVIEDNKLVYFQTVGIAYENQE
jgi:hypothetical protein